MADGEALPLFPLSTVLVPGLVLPLHIFEPRYRQLLADLQSMPEDERAFGVVAIRDGYEVGSDGVRALHGVGTQALLREVEELADGTFDIVTVGTTRFRLLDLHTDKPYLSASVEEIPEEEGDGAEEAAVRTSQAFADYRAHFGDDELELPTDPGVLSYLVAAAVVIGIPERQALLEVPDDAERLRQELAFLRRENALIDWLPSIPALDLVREPFSPN